MDFDEFWEDSNQRHRYVFHQISKIENIGSDTLDCNIWYRLRADYTAKVIARFGQIRVPHFVMKNLTYVDIA